MQIQRWIFIFLFHSVHVYYLSRIVNSFNMTHHIWYWGSKLMIRGSASIVSTLWKEDSYIIKIFTEHSISLLPMWYQAYSLELCHVHSFKCGALGCSQTVKSENPTASYMHAVCAMIAANWWSFTVLQMILAKVHSRTLHHTTYAIHMLFVVSMFSVLLLLYS